MYRITYVIPVKLTVSNTSSGRSSRFFFFSTESWLKLNSSPVLWYALCVLLLLLSHLNGICLAKAITINGLIRLYMYRTCNFYYFFFFLFLLETQLSNVQHTYTHRFLWNEYVSPIHWHPYKVYLYKLISNIEPLFGPCWIHHQIWKKREKEKS